MERVGGIQERTAIICLRRDECQCQCQSEFVNMAKITKLFRSPREHKTVRRPTVTAISQEMSSERGMSLDVDGRQAEKGKTEC